MKTLISLFLGFSLLGLTFMNDFSNEEKLNGVSASNFSYVSDNMEIKFNPQDSMTDAFEQMTTPLKDVSSMFNERGYSKSNAFSFDEQEIINDFNGGLMYSVPLYYFNCGGEINLQMKLNYNSNVGHIFTAGDTTTISNSLTIKARQNFNFPEWIIDLNGIGIQTFNFETNFFIRKGSQTYFQGNEVNALISGYHYDNELRALSVGNPDVINILAGDGSVISLQNTYLKTSDLTDYDNFIGDYIYNGKESYYKARVTYINPSHPADPGYNPRKVVMSKGDGLEYIFSESYIDFTDMKWNNTAVNPRVRPMALYLDTIRDRFSHAIAITYSDKHPYSVSSNEPLVGRKILESIQTTGISSTITKGQIWAEFGPQLIKLFHSSPINGNYSFYLERPVSYRSTDDNKNQRGYVSKVVNILNQKTEFVYKNFTRKYQNLFSPGVGLTDISLNNARRIDTVKNNLGLKRSYSYFGADSISIDLQPYYYETNLHILSTTNTSIYKGNGRDPFFTNMLSSKYEFANVLKSVTSFNYIYDDDSRPDVQTKPVDSSDIYETIKAIEYTNKPSWDTSSPGVKTKRTYRVYPTNDPNNLYVYTPDAPGTTKLIIEDVLNFSNDASLKKTEFTYWVGRFVTSLGGYNGSFLMKRKVENYQASSATKKWTWDYVYQDNDTNKPIIQTKETDPFNNYSITKYSIYDTEIWHKKFVSDFNYNSGFIKSYYYRISIPTKEIKYSANNDSLLKKTYTYIEDTASTLGYYGQLISEKIYNSNGFSEYVETNYEYCKNDTNGRYIFDGTGVFPYKEGNLKIKRTLDQETKFFYNPLTLNEVYKNTIPVLDEPAGIPRLKYKKLYNNSSVLDTNSLIWDFRLPIRTDMYKVNGAGRDTLSISYKEYTLDGSPTKMIDRNKYLTELIYQPVQRISSITLPGDFSPSSNAIRDTLIFHDNLYNETIEINANGWGLYNLDDLKLYFTQNSHIINTPVCHVFSMNVTDDETQTYAFMKFDGEILNNFYSIDSSNLYLWPIEYKQEITVGDRVHTSCS